MSSLHSCITPLLRLKGLAGAIACLFFLGACSSINNTSTKPVILTADTSDTLSAKQTIEAALGKDTVEDQAVPNCEQKHGHALFGPHIREVKDTDLGKDVFEFVMHRDEDVDCFTSKTGRQRLEIKTFAESPEYLKAAANETHEYRWKMKLSKDFQASHRYTHLFQLKPVGGTDHSMPLITLTAVFYREDEGDGLGLQVRHSPGKKAWSKLDYLDVTPFLGKWVDITVRATYSERGPFAMTIRDLAGKEIWSYYSDELDMLRNKVEFTRPKWGIYRSLQNAEQLRDETLWFADFCVAKGEDHCADAF